MSRKSPVPKVGTTRPSFPRDSDINHRAFVIRSLDRCDQDLAALVKVNRTLHDAKQRVVQQCGEACLLDMGRGRLTLAENSDVLQGDVEMPTSPEVCIDFLLRMKLRRKLLNRLARRLNRVSHAMDGEDVTPPGPPKYGDLRLHVDPVAIKEYEKKLTAQQEARKRLKDAREQKEDEGKREEQADGDDSMDIDGPKEKKETSGKSTKHVEDTVAKDGDKEQNREGTDGEQVGEKETAPENSTSSRVKAEVQQSSNHEKPISQLEYDTEILKDYKDTYEKKFFRSTGVVKYSVLDQEVEEDHVAIKYGAGIGASHRSMSSREKELEWKRWQIALLGRVPDQPTFKELGLENRVFLLQERLDRLKGDEEAGETPKKKGSKRKAGDTLSSPKKSKKQSQESPTKKKAQPVSESSDEEASSEDETETQIEKDESSDEEDETEDMDIEEKTEAPKYGPDNERTGGMDAKQDEAEKTDKKPSEHVATKDASKEESPKVVEATEMVEEKPAEQHSEEGDMKEDTTETPSENVGAKIDAENTKEKRDEDSSKVVDVEEEAAETAKAKSSEQHSGVGDVKEFATEAPSENVGAEVDEAENAKERRDDESPIVFDVKEEAAETAKEKSADQHCEVGDVKEDATEIPTEDKPDKGQSDRVDVKEASEKTGVDTAESQQVVQGVVNAQESTPLGPQEEKPGEQDYNKIKTKEAIESKPAPEDEIGEIKKGAMEETETEGVHDSETLVSPVEEPSKKEHGLGAEIETKEARESKPIETQDEGTIVKGSGDADEVESEEAQESKLDASEKGDVETEEMDTEDVESTGESDAGVDETDEKDDEEEEDEEEAGDDDEDYTEDEGDKKDEDEIDDSGDDDSQNEDGKDNDDESKKTAEESLISERKKSMSLAAVPSFYEQDMRRIRLIHADLMANSIHEHARQRITEATNDYNYAFRTSNDLYNRRSKVQDELNRILYEARLRLSKMKSDYGLEVAIAKAQWQKRKDAWNAQRMQNLMMSRPVIGTSQTAARASSPDPTVSQVAATLSNVVDAVVVNAESGSGDFEPFAPPPAPSLAGVVDPQSGESVEQIYSRRESQLRGDLTNLSMKLQSSEEERKRAWKKMLKTRAEFEMPTQQWAPGSGRRGRQVDPNQLQMLPLPPLRASAPAQAPPIMGYISSVPAYVPPSGASRTPAVARAPYGSVASTSKYSIDRVRERVAADGSVAPVSLPKKNKDGLYQRPAGRTRKGMEWDAVKGIWVPNPGGS